MFTDDTDYNDEGAVMAALKATINSALFWMIFFTIGLFTFLTFGARPLLRLLGMLLGAMGGQGLEGTDL